jgi:threonine synthase
MLTTNHKSPTTTSAAAFAGHSFGEVEYVCASCQGNLDVQYDYDGVRAQLIRAPLADDRNFTMWRYHALLPIDDLSFIPPLTVGWTPVYDCPAIARRHRVRQLLIKDDGRNPTASFKDRPSALCVAKAREAGARIITTASSGNAGSALAGMCASVGMESVMVRRRSSDFLASSNAPCKSAVDMIASSAASCRPLRAS